MKKFTLPTFLILILTLISNPINAQDGYTYTLVHNGNYDFTIQAIPNTSANNFATSVQSYGFTILLPDGATATLTSSLGNGAGATFFDGNNVGDNTIDGYLITEVLGGPISLSAPSTATNSDMVSFTVNGNPTGGELKILENNSTLATTITSLKSFITADMIDDNMAIFTNVVDPNEAAVSGISSFSFHALSTPQVVTNTFSIFPNPTKDIVNIKGNTSKLLDIEIYAITGKLVKRISNNTNLNTLDLSRLNSGVYFLSLHTDTNTQTIRIIKH